MTPCYVQMCHLLLNIFFVINSLTKLVSKQVTNWDITTNAYVHGFSLTIL